MQVIFKFLTLSLLFLTGFPLLLNAQLRDRGLQPSAVGSSIEPKETYAIITGVSDYESWPKLPFAAADVCLFKQFLQSEPGGNVPDSNMVLLVNDSATMNNWWTNSVFIKQKVKPGNRLYIYFAGHGASYNDEYLFIAHKCKKDGDPGLLKAFDAILMDQVKRFISQLTSKNIEVILVLDACRTSGDLEKNEPKIDFYKDIVVESKGEIQLLASREGGAAYENENFGGGHGLFTYYLVKGLMGAADNNKDRVVTLNEINQFVSDSVWHASSNLQEPMVIPPLGISKYHPMSTVDTLFNTFSNTCAQFPNRPTSRTPSNKTNSKAPKAPAPTEKRSGFRGRGIAVVDTSAVSFYRRLQASIEEYQFRGPTGANAWMDSLSLCCAQSPEWKKARKELAVAYLNFGQELINQYLMTVDTRAFTRSFINLEQERDSIRRVLQVNHEQVSKKIAKYGKRRRQKWKTAVGNWKKEEAHLAQLLHYADSLEAGTNHRLELLQESNFKEAAQWIRTGLSWIDQDSVLHRVYEQRIRVLDLYAAHSHVQDSSTLVRQLDSLAMIDSAVYTLHLLAKSWTKLGRYDLAEKALYQAIDEAKKWAYPYNNLGEIFDLQQKYKDAEICYRNAISIDSMFVYADNNLAMNLEMQQRFDDAKAVYEAALMKDGGYAMTYNNLGQLYLKQGNLDEAILYFKKAVEVQPEHPFSTENLFNQYLLREEAEEVARLGLEARRLRSDTSLLDRVLPAGGGQDPASELVEVVPGKRLALVIGNMRYPKGASRRYHETDADEMEAVLKKTGFVVKKVKNATRKEFKQALQQFSSELASGTYEAALFYYAGHSVALEGRNYLQPIDAAPGSAAEVAATCLDLQEVMLHLSIAPETAKLLLLDVGYENPFLKNWHPRAEKGGVLDSIIAPYRSMLVFSQEQGNIPVFDIINDVYKTSAFSRGMASFWEQPKWSLDQVMQKAGEQIREEARLLGQVQRLWVTSNGLEGFSLTAPATEALLAYRPCKGFLDTILGRMVLVKGGAFTMGCATETAACERDELPTHRVTLSDYYLSETEVTQAQWWAVMGTRPSAGKPCEECPVENVSWEDIQEFLERLNQSGTGVHYRLPTEAEWEFAARGGLLSEGSVFSGSATLDEVGWYDSNTKKGPQPVKQKRPNELGIYDLSGNIQEWCADRFGTYSARGQRNPVGPLKGNYRVHRGGSWNEDEEAARLSYRLFNAPTSRQASLGFRVAASMQRGRRTY